MKYLTCLSVVLLLALSSTSAEAFAPSFDFNFGGSFNFGIGVPEATPPPALHLGPTSAHLGERDTQVALSGGVALSNIHDLTFGAAHQLTDRLRLGVDASLFGAMVEEDDQGLSRIGGGGRVLASYTFGKIEPIPSEFDFFHPVFRHRLVAGLGGYVVTGQSTPRPPSLTWGTADIGYLFSLDWSVASPYYAVVTSVSRPLSQPQSGGADVEVNEFPTSIYHGLSTGWLLRLGRYVCVNLDGMALVDPGYGASEGGLHLGASLGVSSNF